MNIFQAEKEIAELIKDNKTSSFVQIFVEEKDFDTSTLLAKCSGDACPCVDTKAIASRIESEDVMPISSILVTDLWNANNDIFTAEEMVSSRDTPRYKPINWMHRGSEDTKNENIGVMIEAELVKGGVDSLNYFTQSDLNYFTSGSTKDTISGKVHIKQDGIIWSQYFPSYAKKIKKGISEGELFVSMECFFEDFDYGLKDDSGDLQIIKRDESNAKLSKSLKQYGGSGKIVRNGKDYKIGRVLRNITFSGQGIVKEPANVNDDKKIVSIILNEDQIKREKVESQVENPSSSPLNLLQDMNQQDSGMPGMPGMPEQTQEQADPREEMKLPTTYDEPENYLFNTPEEAKYVAENELGCFGYHVYLENRHSETPFLFAQLIGDPDDLEKQFMRPKYLPCTGHREFLFLVEKKGFIGDQGGGGGGRGGCPSGTQVCININGNTITYETDVAIKSFSMSHGGCAEGFSGGVIGTLGFNVTSDNQSVSGTSTGRPIAVGSGVLLSFNGQVTKECLSSLSFIGENDQPLVANLHIDVLAPTSQPTDQNNENKGGGRPDNGMPGRPPQVNKSRFTPPPFGRNPMGPSNPAPVRGPSQASEKSEYYKFLSGYVVEKNTYDTLVESISEKNKLNGYKRKEEKVQNMSEQNDFESMYNEMKSQYEALKAEVTDQEMTECSERVSSLEKDLHEAHSALEEANVVVASFADTAEELKQLRSFAEQAEEIISELEKVELGKSRIADLQTLAGDVYGEDDLEEISSMDDQAFATLKDSLERVIEKIEASVEDSEEAEEEVFEDSDLEYEAPEADDEAEEIIQALEASKAQKDMDMIVSSNIHNDTLSTARSLINKAMGR